MFPWETIAFPCVSPKQNSFSMSLSWNLTIKWRVKSLLFPPKKTSPVFHFLKAMIYMISSLDPVFTYFSLNLQEWSCWLICWRRSFLKFHSSCQPSTHRKSSKKRCWTSVGSRSSLKFHRALAGHGKITGFLWRKCGCHEQIYSKIMS